MLKKISFASLFAKLYKIQILKYSLMVISYDSKRELFKENDRCKR